MSKFNDTIYALSTPTGKSAVALIRVSGNQSLKILKTISSIKKIKPKKATLTFLKIKKTTIDQVITTYFKKPNSFTGEEMIEINCHGSIAIINKISQILKKLGARLAEPGEFTKRAFMNNKIDLIQTESLSDLINSETEKQRSLAISNLKGGLNLFINSIHKDLKYILSNIEALIDFSEEDLPKNILNKISERNKNIVKSIEKELNRSKISAPIRAGFVVSIVGKPNTGKSSFINYISNKEVSIVTNLPGTTTDTVTSSLDIDGYKFTFIDTAGIRKHKNKIEEIGIKKTLDAISISNMSMVFLNSKERNNYKKIQNKIFVRSKLDIRKKIKKEQDVFNISSKTGEGISEVLRKIKENLVKSQKNEPLFSRERHIDIMKKTLKELKSIKKKDNIDIQAFKYREALRLSLEINEKFDIEHILDIIFSDFCIGK